MRASLRQRFYVLAVAAACAVIASNLIALGSALPGLFSDVAAFGYNGWTMSHFETVLPLTPWAIRMPNAVGVPGDRDRPASLTGEVVQVVVATSKALRRTRPQGPAVTRRAEEQRPVRTELVVWRRVGLTCGTITGLSSPAGSVRVQVWLSLNERSSIF
jgi:hypothetical protein